MERAASRLGASPMAVGQADLDRVRTLPLFTEAAPETFSRLSADARLVAAKDGEGLLTEGRPTESLYVLLSGTVELEGTWNERETTLAIARPLFAFPLASVVLDRAPLFAARAIGRAEMIALSASRVRAAMHGDARFAVHVAMELAGSYRALLRSLKNQKLRGGLERLANYLISLRAEQGGATTISLPHDKRRLASLLGMTPENLSRAFANLAEHGVVVRGRAVAITRPEALDLFAKPDPLIDAAGGADGLERWSHGGLYAA